MGKSLINQQQIKRHHYFRTIVSSFFGFIALALIIVSILVVWLGRTLTNTNQYVATVAPLVTKPDVQNFVVDKVVDTLLDRTSGNSKDQNQQNNNPSPQNNQNDKNNQPGSNQQNNGQNNNNQNDQNNNNSKDQSSGGDGSDDGLPIRDIAQKILTPDQIVGKTDDQLKAEVTPIVKDSIRTIVSSAAFAQLWKDNNQAIHAQLISQLSGSSQTITLNFHPLVTGVIDQLGTTKLAFIKDKLDVKDDQGVVTLKGKQLDNVRNGYNYFKKAMIAIVACALLASALCILISVHHLKTIRRIALMTGIFAGLLAALLSATSLIKANGDDAVTQKMAVTLINSITHDLRLTLIVIAVAGIGGAIISKVYAVMMRRNSGFKKK